MATASGSEAQQPLKFFSVADLENVKNDYLLSKQLSRTHMATTGTGRLRPGTTTIERLDLTTKENYQRGSISRNK